jgi:SAM-dependent methyltransferase
MLQDKMMAEPPSVIEQHYSRSGLTERILATLRDAGFDVAAVSYKDLAPLDQFHTRGRDATVELARLAGLASGTRVLDVGCGIGGPARLLAAEFGCHVTGIDLTAEFCEAATRLTELAGLSERVQFRRASALDLPFADAAFEAAWTQHVSMNISDKDRMYTEIHRVLKPGGRVAIYDVAAGLNGSIHFPVPWATGQSASFLLPPEEMQRKMEAAGLEIVYWNDATAEATEWFQARQGQAPPKLGLHLLMGQEWPTMIANQARNLAENRVAMVKAVLEKRA